MVGPPCLTLKVEAGGAAAGVGVETASSSKVATGAAPGKSSSVRTAIKSDIRGGDFTPVLFSRDVFCL